MIRPLRDVHRRSFYLMAAVVPLLFAAGIIQRSPQTPTAHAVRSADATVWPSGLVATRIERSVGETSLRLEIRRPLRQPDPLLYFTKGVVPPDASITQDSLRLGPARDGAHYSLPPTRGCLILYSLGHQKIIDQLAVEVAP